MVFQRRTLACSFLLLAVAGCGPSFKEIQLRQAEQARARGDYVTAATYLNAACKHDPKDEKVCAAAKDMAGYAVRDAIAAAERELAAGQYGQAITRLANARKVDHEGKVGPVLDVAGEKVALKCEGQPVESLVESIRFVRCLEQYRNTIDRKAFSDRVAAGRMRAGGAASRIAASSAAEDRPGAAYAQFSIAQCLSGHTALESSKNEMYGRFYERVAVPLSLQLQLPWATPTVSSGEFCDAMHQTSPILSCRGTLGARTLAVSLVVRTSRPTHQAIPVQREIEYVDHIETYDNPDYRPLQSQVMMERRSIQREREALARAKADCDTADSAWRRARSCNDCTAHNYRDSTCNRADAARTSFNAHESDVNRLERQLYNTPPTLQREVRDIFRYTETTHTYAQDFHMAGQVASAGGRVMPSAQDDRVEYTAIEHVGFLKAGLAPSPLVVPQQQQYRRDITARANAFAQEMTNAELMSRSAEKLAQCSNPKDNAQLDCWLEAQMLKAPDPVPAYTQVLSEDVGTTYPPTGCK